MNSGNKWMDGMSEHLFWDMDRDKVNFEVCPSQIIGRVLECGMLEDWHIIVNHYGLERIVNECQQFRYMDPVALSFISTISDTPKESFRCYNTKP